MTPSFFSSLRSRHSLLSRKRRVRTDEDHPEVDAQVFCVRERRGDLGVRDAFPHEVTGPKMRGIGTLRGKATDEIEERIDLEEHVGETIATVYCDLDAWDYEIEYHVGEDSLVERVREVLRR